MTTANEKTAPEEPHERTDGPVHTWFSLSYANFLVWHRAHMQSMPLEWQERFVDLAEEMEAAYPDHAAVDYEVATVDRNYVGELTGAQMCQLGITRASDDEDENSEEWAADDPRWGVYYDRDGRELTGHDYVGIPAPDPVPHYRHAYLPPDEAGIAAHRQFRAEHPR